MRVFRDYQQACLDALRHAYSKLRRRRVLIELATGAGKGCIIAGLAAMVREKRKRVLIIVNRDILIGQLIDELKFWGVFAQREQGQDRATLTADVVVASVQSLHGGRLTRWPQDYFDFVITDEAHFSAAKTFRVVLDHFRNAFHCFLTATAERHDGKGLWDGIEDIVFRRPLKTYHDNETGETWPGLIDEGWLVPFKFEELDVPVTLDEKLMRKSTFGENEEVFDSNLYLPKIAKQAIEAVEGKKSLFFMTNCRTSNFMADLIRAEGIDCKHVDSSYMSESDMRDVLEWFDNSKNGILCNAQLLTTGYNQKDIQAIGLMRPIASPVAYKQILGRGTRALADVDAWATAEERKAAIAASEKPFCKVVNVFFENGSHDLCSPSCLITDDKAERKALDEAKRKGAPIDLEMMESQLKAKRMADIDEEARKYAEKVARSQEKKPRAGGVYIADILRSRNPSHKVATQSFVKYVRSMGVTIPDGVYSGYQMMKVKQRLEKARK